MKYLDILPINYIDYLTYSLPSYKEKTIKPGQKIIVPFGNKKVEGIFIKYSKKPKFKTKPISFITKDFIITSNQTKLLQYLSDYYFCSPAKALKLLNKCKNPKNKEENKDEEKKFIVLTKNTKNLYKKILEKNKNKNNQLLFIFPDIKNINEFININKKEIKDYKYVIFTSSINDKEKEIIAKKVNQKDVNLIIGTRTALFLPYINLKTIIICYAGEDGHFSEETPRYNSIDIAEKIIENKNINLIIQNEIINEYLYIKSTKNYKLIKEKNENKSLKITIVKEPLCPSIGYTLESKIKNTFKKNKKVAIFLNNKGENNILMCKDCKNVLVCTNCKNKLLTNNKETYCKNCDKIIKNIPNCNNCGGINIFSPGITIKKTISEIKKIFPQKIILELSKNNNKNVIKNYDIVIGTKSIKNINFDDIESLIILYPENIINIPGYNSESKALYTLSTIKEKLKKNSKLYIKTFLEEENVIKSLISGKYFDFYKEKIKEFKKYGYPPFKDIIEIEIKDKNNNKLFEIEKKIKNHLINYELMSEYELKNKGYFKKKLFFRTMKNEIIYDTILKSFKNITIERNPKKGI